MSNVLPDLLVPSIAHLQSFANFFDPFVDQSQALFASLGEELEEDSQDDGESGSTHIQTSLDKGLDRFTRDDLQQFSIGSLTEQCHRFDHLVQTVFLEKLVRSENPQMGRRIYSNPLFAELHCRQQIGQSG